MPYAKLLDKSIQNSGMTAKEIAQKCSELGAEVTPSYLSLLRNEEKKRVASDEISIALAKVLGLDENHLVLERYLDSAPDVLKTAIYGLYRASIILAAGWNNETLSEEQMADIEEKIAQFSMAKVILDLNKLDFSENSHIKAQHAAGANYIDGLPVEDNAMYPTIKKGDQVKILLTDHLNSGDIVAFIKDETVCCRQFQQVGETHTLLLAYNPEFPQLTYENEEITLLGKVHSVTTVL